MREANSSATIKCIYRSFVRSMGMEMVFSYMKYVRLSWVEWMDEGRMESRVDRVPKAREQISGKKLQHIWFHVSRFTFYKARWAVGCMYIM